LDGRTRQTIRSFTVVIGSAIVLYSVQTVNSTPVTFAMQAFSLNVSHSLA